MTMATMQRSEHTTYLFNYSNPIGLDINNAIRLEKCMGKTAIPQNILNASHIIRCLTYFVVFCQLAYSDDNVFVKALLSIKLKMHKKRLARHIDIKLMSVGI